MTEPMALLPRRRPAHLPRRPRRRPARQSQSERVRLIEFVWVSPTGVQPVLLIDREFLH
jgi:hypothetical protein